MVSERRMHRFLVQCFLLIGFGFSAKAAEVAVLDFDSFGLTHDEASLVSQGFRDAFLEEGRFFPLEGYDISDRLASGREEDLSRARFLVAEARTKLNAGRATQAIQMLEEAESLHRSAGSHIARRAQLSDVYFFLGQAQLRTNRGRDAQVSFQKMLKTYPGYQDIRAANVSTSVASAIERAEVTRSGERRDLRDAGEVQSIAARLGVSVVVVGVVDSNGQLHVRLIQEGRIQGEIRKQLQEVPPFPGDPIYLEMIKELALTVQGGSSNAGFQSPPDFNQSSQSNSFSSSSSSTFAEPSFNTDSQAGVGQEQQREETPLPDSIGKERSSWWKFWEKMNRPTREPVTGRINVSGRTPRPLTQQWWFWGATGAVVVGGGIAAAVLLEGSEDSPESGDGPSYRVTIETN